MPYDPGFPEPYDPGFPQTPYPDSSLPVRPGLLSVPYDPGLPSLEP